MRVAYPMVVFCLLLGSGCHKERDGILSVSPEAIELQWNAANDGHETIAVALHNIGGRSMRIKNVTATCSCVTPKLSQSIVRPGEKAELSLDVHVAQYGVQEVFITLETDSERTPSEVLVISMSGEQTEIPRIWYAAPTTLLNFQVPEQELIAEIEIVTLESAESSPWITELLMNSEESDTKVEWQMVSFKDELGGEKGAIVRTYEFKITAIPMRFEHTVVSLEVKTSDISKQKIAPIQIVLDAAPAVRVLPSKLEIHRESTGASEAELILIAEDGRGIDVINNNDLEWCQFVVESNQSQSSNHMRRVKVKFDWESIPHDVVDEFVLTLGINHATTNEVRVPVIFTN